MEDKRVYHLAYLFWKNFFEKATTAVELDYTTYLNTTGEHDGNPIFHAYLPARKRALRIIQVDPSEAEENIDIKAWLDKATPTEIETAVPELVIDMILSEGSKELGQRLIQAWIEDEEVWTDSQLASLLEV